jgi:anti-anti-sigma factor
MPDPALATAGTESEAAATSHGFVCLCGDGDDGTIRCALSGELDIATASELDQALQTAQSNAGLVTLDLRRLSFMDCRGLAVILTAAERAATRGNRFRVVRGPPHVHRLFSLTSNDRRIEIIAAG